MTPIQIGVIIILALLLIYIFVHVKSLASSPLGQALTSLLGTAGTILTALASLPPWLIIGLGSAYLLGSAILKMMPSKVIELAKGVAASNDDIANEVKTQGLDSAALAKSVAGKLVARGRANNSAADTSNAEAAALSENASNDAVKIDKSLMDTYPEEVEKSKEIVEKNLPLDPTPRG